MANRDSSGLGVTDGTDADPYDEKLCHAARQGKPADVRALVELDGANVNCRFDGLTPLMLACFADGHTPIGFDESQALRMKVVQTLLENKADVHAQNAPGWTPLFFATFYAQHDIVPLLLAAGADAKHHDSTGRDASSWLRWSEPDREKQKPLLKTFYAQGLSTPVFQLVKNQMLSNEFFCPMGLDGESRKVAERIPNMIKLKKIAEKDRQAAHAERKAKAKERNESP